MSAPQITKAMLRANNVIYDTPDEHAFLKLLNQTIAEKYESNNGKCQHKPSSIVATVSGDFSQKANGSFCCYCGEEIYIDRIVWATKSQLPSRPA